MRPAHHDIDLASTLKPASQFRSLVHEINSAKRMLVRLILLCGLLGVTQSQTTTQCRGQADIIFVIDSSGSVGEDNFKLILDFINVIIDNLDIGPEATRVGALTFESTAVKRFDLNDYTTKDELKSEVSKIPFVFGSTATLEGIQLMLDMFSTEDADRAGIPNIGIVITDGNAKTGDPIPKAQEAMADGILMFAVAIRESSEFDVSKIKPLASDPVDNYFEVTDFTKLGEITDAVTQGACVTTEICPDTQTDVAFLIDSSSSITPENFNKVKDFIINVIGPLTISSDRVRVGVISFSGIAQVDFYLNRYSTKTDVQAAINNIQQMNQGTNTNLALDLLVNDFFTASNGDRTFAPNVAIIITDGQSDDSTATKASATVVKDAGIAVFAIGVGFDGMRDTIDYENELNILATDFDHIKMLTDHSALEVVINGVASFACVDPGCKDRKADFIFLLDASSSITAANFTILKDFVKAVINRLDVSVDHDRVGILTFSQGTKIWFHLNRFITKGNLLNELDAITQEGGSTHTAEGIRVANNQMFTTSNGDRAGVQNVIVLVTDGMSKEGDPIPEAEQAKANGTIIFCVGIGPEFGPKGLAELNAIATSPNREHVFEVKQFTDLGNIAGTIAKEGCYKDPCKDIKYDMCVLLDNSGSIILRDYQLLLDFMSSVVNELKIDPDFMQIALVTFNSIIRPQWNLTTYPDRIDLRNAISSLPAVTANATNHADAIAYANDVIFQESNGDRPDAINLMMIITDGKSTVKQDKTEIEARRAKEAGAVIIAIGIGEKDLSINDLNVMASDPDQAYVFTVKTYSDLEKIKDTLITRACPAQDPTCNGKADIVLAVDSSGSITEDQFKQMLQFIELLIEQLDIGDDLNKVGMITFNDMASIEFNLNDYDTKNTLIAAVQQIQYSNGATHTWHALNTVRTTMFTSENGDRADFPNIVVVLTDGVSTVQKEKTVPEALLLRQDGVSIVTVAIGNGADDTELLQMASDTSLLFEAQSFEDLPAIVTSLSNAICNNVDECESGPCQNGGVCIDNLNSYTCECPQGYSGVNCERQCTQNVDLIFAIDSSGSIFENNFKLLKQFVMSVIQDLPVSNSGTRVGVLTFASTSSIIFHLNAYTDRKSAMNAVERIPYKGGATNIADALQLIRLAMLTSNNGARDNARDAVILITDGAANVNEDDTQPQARMLRNNNVHIMAIGVGHEMKPYELRGMATDPDSNNVRIVNSFSDLGSVKTVFTSPTCFNQQECASNPCQGGAQCNDGLNYFECVCPRGRAGPTCALTCDGRRDIVFILDSSGSIGQEDFEKSTRFVQQLVDNFDITSGQYRVGLVRFSDGGQVMFHLNSYNRRSDILNAISSVDYVKGATNTARGLELMRSMFSPVNGDRSDVPNLAYLITDGIPTVRKGQEVDQANSAKNAGITIKTIGVGPNVDADKLGALASSPTGENTSLIANFDALEDAISSLRGSVCS
ncbi:unnamed protein product [Owenia fusiformis]|uniref:Uncharacterized protein n=1 Tax=Owenia fusiformis TaxID=6347 RepID=A0A8J1XH38_OWEFU|nr:unnamed protein product [Owenia fusiformis]